MATDSRQFTVKCRQCGRLGSHLNGPQCFHCGAFLPPPGAAAPSVPLAQPSFRVEPPFPRPAPVAPPTTQHGEPASAWLLDQPNFTMPQQAPPSRPLAPPYSPQGYAPPGGYVPQAYGAPPPWQAAPPLARPPRRKRSPLSLIIGIVVASVLVAGGCVATVAAAPGLLSRLAAQRQLGGANATPVASLEPGAWTHIAYQDSLTSDHGGWSVTHCRFAGDGYHVSPGYVCFAPAGAFQAAEVTVTVRQLAGDPGVAYGVAVRRVSSGNEYHFIIDSEGDWIFDKIVGGKRAGDIATGSNVTALHQGLNQPNTMRVRMSGSHFTFFVNGAQVGEASDATFTTGELGVFLGTITGTDAVFTNLIVTTP
ncbi:MAG TPA: hypothetical protein VF807_08020 [Ktedonobacterales bacterium]